MELLAAKCPNCGGDLQLPDDKKQVKCKYCGFDIVVREAVNKAQANVDNLLKLASSAQETGNYQEAYDYFTKVLEFDADNYLAQFGKGLCAAKLSTPEKFRFDELKIGIINSVNNAPDDKKEELKEKAIKELNRISKINVPYNGLYIKSKPLLTDRQKIESLEIIYSFEPQNIKILEDIIFAVSRHNDKRERYLNELQAIAPEKAKSIREILETAEIEQTKQRKKERKEKLKSRQFEKYVNAIGEISGIAITIVIILLIVIFCAYCGSR